MKPSIRALLALFAGACQWTATVAQNAVPPSLQNLPPQSVFIDPHSFAVLGPNGTFRNDSFSQFFNPTSTSVPFFQIFDPAFLDILGPNPSFHEVASNATFGFAQEAPIWVPETDEVFFSNANGPPFATADINHNNGVGKISLKAVEAAVKNLKPGVPVNVPVTELDLPDTVQMTNGGTGPFKSSLVLATSGRGPLPPSIVLVNPKAPHNTTVLVDNYFGRQFNSLNDVKIHPTTGAIYFTDCTYGSIIGFRGPPLLPNQVYRLDPVTSSVRVVATDFNKSNGIAFTPDGKIAYIADSGVLANGGDSNDPTKPATIYMFDVDPENGVFLNRRVFAFSDAGIPDGIQVDAANNVYSACGDGTHVWSPTGTLLGKFFIGMISANMVFAGDGRLVIVARTKIFFAKIAAQQGKVAFP